MAILRSPIISRSIINTLIKGSALLLILSAVNIFYKLFEIPDTHQFASNHSNQTKYTHSNQLESQNKLNILIATPIDCKVDILEYVQTLTYNHDQKSIYWYFNVYNHKKCEEPQNYTQLMIQTNKIKVITQNVMKSIFWSIYLDPNKITNVFNKSMDYIWMPDDDLMLKLFNFDGFIKISSLFNQSITQPSIMSMCKKCRGSFWYFLNHNHRQNNPRSNAVIGYTVPLIEIMAPLFPMKTWQTIYPYFYYQYMILGKDLNTNWANNWWCGAVKLLMNAQSPQCVVIYYTPIIHMNTKTMQKTEEYRNDGHEMRRRIQNNATFARFVSAESESEWYNLNDSKQIDSSNEIQFLMNELLNNTYLV